MDIKAQISNLCEQEKNEEAAVSGQIQAADELVFEADSLSKAKRPVVITSSFLTLHFKIQKYDPVTDIPGNLVAEFMFLESWSIIDHLPHDQCHEARSFLSEHRFVHDGAFTDHLTYYKNEGVIAETFPTDTIMGSKGHTEHTLQALLGLYLGKLPANAVAFYTFTLMWSAPVNHAGLERMVLTSKPQLLGRDTMVLGLSIPHFPPSPLHNNENEAFGFDRMNL